MADPRPTPKPLEQTRPAATPEPAKRRADPAIQLLAKVDRLCAEMAATDPCAVQRIIGWLADKYGADVVATDTLPQ